MCFNLGVHICMSMYVFVRVDKPERARMCASVRPYMDIDIQNSSI